MGASDLPVGRWGNSLAVRIPAKLAKELGIAEGSVLHAEVLGRERVRLAAKPAPDMAAFVERLARLRESLPPTQPVVEEMRRGARY